MPSDDLFTGAAKEFYDRRFWTLPKRFKGIFVPRLEAAAKRLAKEQFDLTYEEVLEILMDEVARQ